MIELNKMVIKKLSRVQPPNKSFQRTANAAGGIQALEGNRNNGE